MSSDWTFAVWYERHRDGFNRERRDRYQSDPAYRAKVLKRNRDSRKRRKDSARVERTKQRQASLVSTKNRGWKVVDVAFYPDGREVKGPAYTVGVLAAVLGRSIQSVRAWIREGRIKSTPLRSRRGDRVYTPDMVESIVRTFTPPSNTRRKTRTPVALVRVRYADGTVKAERLFRIRMFAEALNRTRDAVIALEMQQRIPTTPLRSGGGQRLYTSKMILAAKTAFEEKGDCIRGEAKWQSLYEDIHERWGQLQVWGASVVASKEE